ncbi:nuclease [Rhizobium sp. R72]|uniref:thermonuclease family protein n=1 Tax=unclassified Rhizobium TaxID=2613769 RepID=UPI000B53387B|nr:MULTISPECIES: thermonuclease family protein [unclassified Rhizobium]OWW00990.1 nuclease [Rhizobium sp. R72]OWW01369.1 nuclease [Rhizobium sp. R711]
MRKIVSFVALALAATPVTAVARDEIEGPVFAEILRVIDGDTLLVEARPWPQQTMEVYVRIRGIDAPEMHSNCAEIRCAGIDARHALKNLTSGSPEIHLTQIAGDKYFGRILANVTLSDGKNPAQDLLEEGIVRAHDGGRKPRETCPAEN